MRVDLTGSMSISPLPLIAVAASRPGPARVPRPIPERSWVDPLRPRRPPPSERDQPGGQREGERVRDDADDGPEPRRDGVILEHHLARHVAQDATPQPDD